MIITADYTDYDHPDDRAAKELSYHELQKPTNVEAVIPVNVNSNSGAGRGELLAAINGSGAYQDPELRRRLDRGVIGAGILAAVLLLR